MNPVRIGVVAPSSVIPVGLLQMGVARLKEEGFSVQVHPSVRKKHFYFAGSDADRVGAFLEYARNPDLDIVWYARGGYGSNRLLPLLEESTRQNGIPSRKLLVGFSDATAVFDYVRERWGWETLHAPMVAGELFNSMSEPAFRAMCGYVRGELARPSWSSRKLRWFTQAPSNELVAPLVGGNLAVWECLIGTPYWTHVKTQGKILFFEEVTESLSRIDRLVHHLSQCGALSGAKAIVLGNFSGCDDHPPRGWTQMPAKTRAQALKHLRNPKGLKPLRASVNLERGLRECFGGLGRKLGIPVGYGLPVGHGPEAYHALPLGATYALLPEGKVELREWKWRIA